MKITCGTDIVEIDRIKEAIETLQNKFVDKIYTKNEIAYCESKKIQKYQHYAARFATKEAIYKALSKYLNNKFDITWKDVEILNDENGRPIVKFLKEMKEIESIDISLSHCKTYAIATAVVCALERKE